MNKEKIDYTMSGYVKNVVINGRETFMIDSKKNQIRPKKCYFNKTSPRELEMARKRKEELYGKGVSWKERYEKRKKALKEFNEWTK